MISKRPSAEKPVVSVSAVCLSFSSLALFVCFVVLNWYHGLSPQIDTIKTIKYPPHPPATSSSSVAAMDHFQTKPQSLLFSADKSNLRIGDLFSNSHVNNVQKQANNANTIANQYQIDSTQSHNIDKSAKAIDSSDHRTTTTTVKKKTIAYAITVTKDGPFVDGALVLGYSAMKVHSSTHGFDSKYDCELIAFVVPTVVTSREILKKFGWRILEKDLPVPLNQIENQDYAMKMKDSGCCGANEFLKLWAYTMTEYHRVVHLDMDSIIYQNMDELYEIDKELLFTGDWNMKAGSPVPPAQGGFLVVRPSMERFREFQAVIQKGDHNGKSGPGWAGSGIGSFWGGQTIQGILPYFYHVLHNGDGLELNRCIYNCMVDNPYRPYADDNSPRHCLNKQPTCEDCRLQLPEKVKSAHFTICQKPWTCTEHTNARNKVLCEVLHEKWFMLRDEFEKDLEIDPSYRATKNNRFTKSRGMCRRFGDKAYLPIPYDKAIRLTPPWYNSNSSDFVS